MVKKCSSCLLVVSLSRFASDLSRKDGLNHRCKQCEQKRAREYRENNPERRKESKEKYYNANREKLIETSLKRYRENREEILLLAKQKRTGKSGYLKSMLACAKARARQKGWDFDIDLDYLELIATDFCPVDGARFDWDREREGVKDGQSACYVTPSLDRIDSTKGYVKGNLRIIGFKWNAWKSNMQLNDLMFLVEYVRSVTKK